MTLQEKLKEANEFLTEPGLDIVGIGPALRKAMLEDAEACAISLRFLRFTQAKRLNPGEMAGWDPTGFTPAEGGFLETYCATVRRLFDEIAAAFKGSHGHGGEIARQILLPFGDDTLPLFPSGGVSAER